MIRIITPWLDHPELIAAYSKVVEGAYIVVIDNGSTPENHRQLEALVRDHSGVLLRASKNMGYAAACNWGLTLQGVSDEHDNDNDIVILLNNDVTGGNWLHLVSNDVTPEGFYGPQIQYFQVDGVNYPYLDGWCIAAHLSVWRQLGFLTVFRGPYCEDIDLCLRARLMGHHIYKCDWPLRHISNVTSRSLPGAYDAAEDNRQQMREFIRLHKKALT